MAIHSFFHLRCGQNVIVSLDKRMKKLCVRSSDPTAHALAQLCRRQIPPTSVLEKQTSAKENNRVYIYILGVDPFDLLCFFLKVVLCVVVVFSQVTNRDTYFGM